MRYDALVPKLGEIRCPALILHGEQDVWIPISYAEELQRRLTNSTLKIIPKSRHVPEIEQFELTTQAVEGFLSAMPDVGR
jgi:pimeloyl-ACP methyl ester carboxylesterase